MAALVVMTSLSLNPSSPFTAQFPHIAPLITKALSSSLFDTAVVSRLHLRLPNTDSSASNSEQGVGRSVTPTPDADTEPVSSSSEYTTMDDIEQSTNHT